MQYITAKWASGKQYSFEMYDYNTKFNEVSWVYLITRKSVNGQHNVIYIWQTGDMKERHSSHHKESCFIKNTPTHKCFLRETNEQTRFNIESDLVRSHKPTCNW